MWGQKMEVFTPKVLAAMPNLLKGMHASLFPEDNKWKDLDQVQLCLKYCSPLCIAGMQKKRKKKRKKKKPK
jgi:hypothetical protein